MKKIDKNLLKGFGYRLFDLAEIKGCNSGAKLARAMQDSNIINYENINNARDVINGHFWLTSAERVNGKWIDNYRKFFKCSADYFFDENMKVPTHEQIDICTATGLSPKSASILIDLNRFTPTIDDFEECEYIDMDNHITSSKASIRSDVIKALNILIEEINTDKIVNSTLYDIYCYICCNFEKIDLRGRQEDELSYFSPERIKDIEIKVIDQYYNSISFTAEDLGKDILQKRMIKKLTALSDQQRPLLEQDLKMVKERLEAEIKKREATLYSQESATAAEKIERRHKNEEHKNT